MADKHYVGKSERGFLSLQKEICGVLLAALTPTELCAIYNHSFVEERGMADNSYIYDLSKEDLLQKDAKNEIVRYINRLRNAFKEGQKLGVLQAFQIPSFVFYNEFDKKWQILTEDDIRKCFADRWEDTMFSRALFFPNAYDNIVVDKKCFNIYSDYIQPRLLKRLGWEIDVCLNNINFSDGGFFGN